MKKLILKIPGLFLFTFGCIQVTIGQDLKADLEKVQERYQSIENLHLAIAVTDRSGSMIEAGALGSGDVKYWKQGRKVHYTMGNVEVIIGDKYLARIDHERKVVNYRVVKKKDWKAAIERIVPPNLDSLFKQYDRVEFLGTEGHTRKYMVYTDQQLITQTELHIDTRDWYISKLIYSYNSLVYGELPDVVTHYKTFDAITQHGSDHFDFGQYLYKSKGNYALKGKLEGYHLQLIDERQFDNG